MPSIADFGEGDPVIRYTLPALLAQIPWAQDHNGIDK